MLLKGAHQRHIKRLTMRIHAGLISVVQNAHVYAGEIFMKLFPKGNTGSLKLFLGLFLTTDPLSREPLPLRDVLKQSKHSLVPGLTSAHIRLNLLHVVLAQVLQHVSRRHSHLLTAQVFHLFLVVDPQLDVGLRVPKWCCSFAYARAVSRRYDRAEGIMTLTNSSSSEFNLLWADVRQHILRHWNVGSGRKCAVSARDLLLKHCGNWDIVAQTFRTTVATFEKRVMSFIEVMHPYLLRKYVHGMASKWSMHELAANGTRFEHYPYARYATDVTFQQTNVPVGSYAEKKLYYSGKHHLYGHKVEVSVLPNGLAINCTSYHKGSVSDKAIFDDNLDFHRTNLTKHPSEMEMTDTGGHVEQWAVLVDKGYQGIQHEVRAVLPTKKPSGGFLTFDQQCTNDRIAADRVIVENYFGRLKTLWAVCGDAYRWNRKNYDVLFQTCVAITNVHIRFNPLRAEDGDANIQYVNRLNAIGLKKIKDKKKAQQKYREKRKTSETEIGSDSENDGGTSQLF
ncbi:hypothetical protein DYB34_009084 [Aphanomyces astaci]|uniref:DDE Tnp4 domain-containing protein n=1 Tax=Aphanomyces astaci TaxID=112090 RepID=A0A418C8N6_APHAT|nr:hypothetical protein DYB34_009084 [Aphanomyces astaci]